jgi:tRNA nucleotidyltransferase (CCA-adding enzyme)
MRFAAALGFEIDGDTAQAMHAHKKLLNNIAAERIAAELNKIIVGGGARAVLSAHIEIIAEIIPEIRPAIGFAQNNPYHCYDVLEHILYSVESAPENLIIRLAMLLHDIGKPGCYTQSDDGVGHFHGHPEISAETAKNILLRLKYDNETVKTVTQLVLEHDRIIGEQHVKRWLNKIGEERFRQLIEVKKADMAAHAEHVRKKNIDMLNGLLNLTDEIIAQKQCFAMKDLAVNGRDLIAAGLQEGAKIGAVLNRLLDMVIDGEAENDKAILLKIAKEMD